MLLLRPKEGEFCNFLKYLKGSSINVFIYSFILVSSMEGYDEQLFSCADSLMFWAMLVEPELISRLTFKVILFTSHSCSYDSELCIRTNGFLKKRYKCKAEKCFLVEQHKMYMLSLCMFKELCFSWGSRSFSQHSTLSRIISQMSGLLTHINALSAMVTV